MIVVATDTEYELAKQRFKHQLILKTGVGGCNVYRALRWVPRWIKLTNFGYCGSNQLMIGTECSVGSVRLYHPGVKYKELTYNLGGNVDCYTACDFVVETNIVNSCVFDMELAFIAAMGFKHLTAIKIVSDNLSTTQYEQTIRS